MIHPKYKHTLLFSEGATRQYRYQNKDALIGLGWSWGWERCRSGKVHLVEKVEKWTLVYGVKAIQGSGYRSLSMSFPSKEEAMAYYVKISHLLTGPADTEAPTI